MEDILFVMVLYKTSLVETSTYKSLLHSAIVSQNNIDLFVYDNSPINFPSYSQLNIPYINIIYTKDETNGGVSKAYNKAYEKGITLSKKWLVLLDQDTQLPEDIILTYRNTINKWPKIDLFAPIIKSAENCRIISPCLYKFNRGHYLKQITPGLNTLTNRSVINCGMCISLKAFAESGKYNPEIKLDFSDFYFIELFKKNVSLKYVVIDTILNHSLSTIEKQTFEQDAARFNYYLVGGKLSAFYFRSSCFVFINAFLRSLKLSVNHRNAFFVKKLLTYYFKGNG